jgi:hypothetical protein
MEPYLYSCHMLGATHEPIKKKGMTYDAEEESLSSHIRVRMSTP